MNFFFGRNNKPEVAEEDENEEENEEDLDQDEEEEQEQDVEVFIIASEGEKKAVLASFDTMRRESLFCDVAFICHGVLFRAHKVVLSSWSRWMRAFLCDSPEEEVLSLDIFTPDAFRAVLDYMYGHSLHLTMEVRRTRTGEAFQGDSKMLALSSIFSPILALSMCFGHVLTHRDGSCRMQTPLSR